MIKIWQHTTMYIDSHTMPIRLQLPTAEDCMSLFAIPIFSCVDKHLTFSSDCWARWACVDIEYFAEKSIVWLKIFASTLAASCMT